jgi:hypothetical protein
MRMFRKQRPVLVQPAEVAAHKLRRMMYHGRRDVANELRQLADGEFASVRELMFAEADRLDSEADEADWRIAAASARYHEVADR